jgi:predicted O-methyltransferase YrrM
MNGVLQSILSSGSVITEDGETRTLRASISRQEGEFLQEMIRSTRPQVSVEVGCAYGISSLYICEALREINATKHIIMDPYQHSTWEGIGLSNIRKAGYLDLVETLLHEVPVAPYAVVVRCSFARQSCGSERGKELGPYGRRCRGAY